MAKGRTPWDPASPLAQGGPPPVALSTPYKKGKFHQGMVKSQGTQGQASQTLKGTLKQTIEGGFSTHSPHRWVYQALTEMLYAGWVSGGSSKRISVQTPIVREYLMQTSFSNLFGSWSLLLGSDCLTRA